MVTGVVPHVGGPLLPPFQMTVLTGKLPQARMGDLATCVGPPDSIMMGSPTVYVVGQMAARMFDPTVHGGVIMKGEFTVLIGESGANSGGAASFKTVVLAPGVEGKGVDADAMKAAMMAAAKEGKPFCEQCWMAANGG
jgi:uncharacterized Zn-binding protein involved in type VI secretion